MALTGSFRLSALDATSTYSVAAFKNQVNDELNTQYPVAKDRYHLYINLGCPWSTGVCTALMLKGLQDCISVTCTKPEEVQIDDQGNMGFVFDKDCQCKLGDGTLLENVDSVNNCSSVFELYQKGSPNYMGPFTLPILWDKESETIVNNDSLDIIRMINSNFNAYAKNKQLNMIPENKQTEIEGTAQGWILKDINKGVYKIGYAESQQQYEQQFAKLYEALDKVERMLEKKKYLIGDKFTIVDLRLF